MNPRYVIFVLFLIFGVNGSIKEKIANTGLLANDEIILVSTLDGALHALTKSIGSTKWILQNKPVIDSPSEPYTENSGPMFFPNPQDGSLYRYSIGHGQEPLKKIPFTIPELVASSPCRSSDGLLYIGKKVDTWIGIDSATGKKQLVLGVDNIEKTCPKPSKNTIYIGRTMYNLVLYEPHTDSKWNVTFFHYSATPTANGPPDYDFVHYTTTEEGFLITLDKKSGKVQWTAEFSSPVVSIYLLARDGNLKSIPITNVSPQTLELFATDLNYIYKNEKHMERPDTFLFKKYNPTLFLGETEGGVYAVPAFVDENTATIKVRRKERLLEGPEGQKATMQPPSVEEDNLENSSVVLLGYYDIPEQAAVDLARLSAGDKDKLAQEGVLPNFNNSKLPHPDVTFDKSLKYILEGLMQIAYGNLTFITSGDISLLMKALASKFVQWTFDDLSHLLILLVTCVLAIVVAISIRQARNYAVLKRELSSQSYSRRRRLDSDTEITAEAVELEDGRIQVGKISFSPKDVLGKGCDGTFVFKGMFENRNCAVKRILPGCFSIADREVELLKHSDRHPNVIRYYCMEQCREFRYISLELCASTLEDYVKQKLDIKISPNAIIYQITSGLHHLHSLNIVHRDLKPSNVLISYPNQKEETKIMISDFGLCRRLEQGQKSFSKKSGVIGTEGWIAPEMMHDASRPTTMIDIFSLGCIYYYIISKGGHPFGNVLERQSRIMSDNFSLSELDREKDAIPYTIIVKMLDKNAENRPTAEVLLKYPIFWTTEFILQFFQDVSDRVEREDSTSVIVANLERDSAEVVRGGWIQYLDAPIQADLNRYRGYDTNSVRALLRALRNKKNHYTDLPLDVRAIFGEIPKQYGQYWIKKFPLLLIHLFTAMQCCKSEPIFTKYYTPSYIFKYRNTVSKFNQAPKISPVLDAVTAALGPIKKGRKRHPKSIVNSNPNYVIPENATFEPHYLQNKQ